jgi:hypothetical protein
MIVLKDFDYHGVAVERLETATKNDMVEILAALDYLVARKAATPVTEKAEKPAAEKPAAEKPAAEKPAAEKPSTKKPAAKKPAAEKEDLLYWHHEPSRSVYFAKASEADPAAKEISENEYHKLKAAYELEDQKATTEAEANAKAEDTPAEVTLEDLKAMAGEYLKAEGGPKLKGLLSGFGAGKMSELEEKDYAEFYEKMASAVGG